MKLKPKNLRKFNMSEMAWNKLESTNAFPWLKHFRIPLCPNEDSITLSGQRDKFIKPEQLRGKKALSPETSGAKCQGQAKKAQKVHSDAFQLDPIFITAPPPEPTESVLWGQEGRNRNQVNVGTSQCHMPPPFFLQKWTTNMYKLGKRKLQKTMCRLNPSMPVDPGLSIWFYRLIFKTS